MFKLIPVGALFVSTLLLQSTVFASGLEKSIPWGGRAAGVAGIGTPNMQGSQALFYNPAGLVSDQTGQDVSLNVSPTWVQFKGPTGGVNAQDSTGNKLLLPFGLMYGNTINDKLGFGAGAYVSGGSSATYKDVSVSGFNGTNEVKTELNIVEVAAGAGYKVMDNLKVGLAWRVVMVNGSLSTIKDTIPSVRQNIQIRDMKDTNFTGFKLGAQYKLNEDTELGAAYRSEVTFKSKGKLGGNVHSAGPTTLIAETNATVSSLFPAALSLGATHALNKEWKILGEYVFTQYSKLTNMAINAEGSAADTVELQFKDQHNIRLAGEYTGMGCPLRFGYVWTSQVTNADYALPTLTAPGPAHTLTVGTGRTFGNFQTDAGLEYTTVSGSGSGAAKQGSKYETMGYALHLGGAYLF